MENIHCYEYLVIGAGPAGLQTGYYLEKGGHDYLIIDKGQTPGEFFKKYPRHGKLISINKVHTGFDDPEVNLRFDWNSLLSDNNELLLKHYSKKYFPDSSDFVQYLKEYADKTNLKIEHGVHVTKISKNEIFKVQSADGKTYHCKYLIMATGVSKCYIPDIPNIELAETYDEFSVDPDDYANQRVLVVGKGNSAFETADNLVETTSLIHMLSPNSVKMAWNTHFVGNLRAVNNNFLDTYQLKSQNALLDAEIKGIEMIDGKYHVSMSYSHAEGEEEILVYDRVLLCTGFRFDNSIFDQTCMPELTINDRFPAQTHEWESVNVPDLYFVGTVTQQRDYKKTTSGFIHGFRYNVKCLYDILKVKNHGQEFKCREVELTPENLKDLIIERINRSSALWQQFGFICDIVVVSEKEQKAYYYEELPVDYINETQFSKNDHYYLITLEYGENIHMIKDVFAIDRAHNQDAKSADRSQFLHPIIRRFSKMKKLSELHIMEHLEANWTCDHHVEPLLEYLNKQIPQELENPV